MLELYENNKMGGEIDERPDVVRSLIPTHEEPFHDNEIFENLSENHLLIFDIPSLTEDETFVNAKLKILTLLDIEAVSKIGIRRIVKMSIYDDTIKQLLDFQEIPIQHLNNSWVTFDVTAPVKNILQSDSKSKYMKIVISVSAFLPQVTDTVKLSLMPIEENFDHEYPVLLLSYHLKEDRSGIENRVIEGGQKMEERRKRSLEDDYEEDTNKIWDYDMSNRRTQMKKFRKMRNTCKKKPLYIDFAEIKYDIWIVQPAGYEAYQCQGRCFYPVAAHLNPTKHAIFQSLLHSAAPSKVSRSCCVPTKLDSISILYVDDNGVLTYRYAYKDMVVVDCGCR
ncbi:unnamed protein product [Phaedon cochleariae]|uniref:TGF-beta family profile domain-containing protein n=1 Tax=Phaedon cochleariae TaxID=80249 RepID=A0A9P0D7Q4_PHACE|nr:unnamed protein product [Phaedon cochleariae]